VRVHVRVCICLRVYMEKGFRMRNELDNDGCTSEDGKGAM